MKNFNLSIVNWPQYSPLGLKTILLSILLLVFSVNLLAQLAPVNPPTGGFAIDGGLRANTPTSPSPFAANQGDWFPGLVAGTGGSVFNNLGNPINSATTGRTDNSGIPAELFNSSSDRIFTTGSKFNDYVENLRWTSGSAPDKNDINNGLYHISRDNNNNQWAFIAGDRLSTNGTSYIDFEFLQGDVTRNSNGTFTGTPAQGTPAGTGGRTPNDMIISMEYTNGGSKPNVFIYQWKLSGGTWSYQPVSLPNLAANAFAETNRGGAETSLPYTAFGTNTYQQYAFVEAAINVTYLLNQTGLTCAGLKIKTLWIKTKASASSTAALKDFVDPIPVNFDFGSLSINPIGPFCANVTTPQSLSVTGIQGISGTFSGPGVSNNQFTPSVAGPGTHTIVFTSTDGSCTAQTTVTVNPTPTITLSPIGAICQGTTSASLAFTLPGSPAGAIPNQYRIDWDNAANTAGLVDVAFTALPASPISLAVPANIAANTYSGTLYVKNSTTGCESAGTAISLVVNANPTITLGSIGEICRGTTTASLPYTGTTATPNQYRIDWDNTANAAGLNDVNYAPNNLPVSPISITVPANIAANTYSGTLYVKNSTTGCESVGYNISLKVNANPTITLSPIGAICQGTTTASLPYTATTAMPNQYSIDWNAAANGAGLVDVSFTALPASPISLSVPANIAAATYTGTIYVKNTTTGCISAGDQISLTVNANPTIVGAAISPICFGATSASVSYTNVTANANQYRIDWNAAANAAGLMDGSYVALPASPFNITVPGNLAANTYSGTIYVRNSTTNCESAGDPISMTVNQQVAGPDVTYIPPTCTETSFKVQVNNPVSGTKYTLTQLNGASYEINYNGSGSVIFQNLAIGQGYRVIATLNNCTSAPTTCGDFSTITQQSQSNSGRITNMAISLQEAQTKVLAAPNPFSDKVRFQLESAVSGYGSLEIFNTQGQRVKTVFQGYVEKGRMQTVEYVVSGQQLGNLLYVFRVGDQRVSGKLLNLK